MKKRNLKKERGITLIALVVTIVVLLILAGISINAVLGNNGLISRAKDAKEKTEQDQVNTEKAINSLVDEMEAILGNGGSGNTGNGDGDGTGDGDEPTTVDGVTIPVGFYYVGGTKDSGLVISDDSADENKYKDQETVGTELTGNQFVWIPVEIYDNFHLIEGYYDGSLQTFLTDETTPLKEAGASETTGTPTANNSTAGTAESIAMYKSVKDNKGFYIARYEAGISGTTANSELSNKIVADGNTKPLSKFGVGVWDWISWGGTSSDTASDGLPGDDTAEGCVKVARSMYTRSSTCGVTSTLCYGVQWDAIMNFIDSNYLTGTCTDDSIVKNSAGKGYYPTLYGSPATTGYYSIKNIYDLAGNVDEYTMESYDGYRVCRSGIYFYNDPIRPASSRWLGGPGFNLDADGSHGFRVALYL